MNIKLKLKTPHRIALAAAGAFLLLPDSGPAPVELQLGHDPCKQIALTAQHAAQSEARADYLLAVAKCVNSGGSFGRCLGQLHAEYREAISLAREQYRARLDVCDLIGERRYDPRIHPADFGPKVTNAFFPLVPGRTLVYRKVTPEGVETIRVTTLRETIEIAGVECAIVRDVVDLDGETIEDTIDWYAQHRTGGVWYFGEIAKNFEDGLLDNLDGSWRTGKDDAKPGILMKARPKPCDAYRQEFLLGEAEDVAIVISVDETVTVPKGTFTGCVQTEDYTPLDPDVRERKFYAPGIGLVLEVDPSTGDRTELIDIIDV